MEARGPTCGSGPAAADADELASVAGPASDAPSRSRRAVPDGVPAEILGVPVSFVAGRISSTHTYNDRIFVRCCNDAHTGCRTSRSLQLLRDRFGVRCAEAFLGAWLAKADSLPSAQHAKYTPKAAEMEAYLVANL